MHKNTNQFFTNDNQVHIIIINIKLIIFGTL